MKNKKGDLMNNVLGVIIAVIGLSLLAYGAYKIYQVVVSSESEDAKKTITIIESKINALKEGETGKFPIRGVKDWYLIGWSGNEVDRPDKCFLNSCMCICPMSKESGSGDFPFAKISKTCQEGGFCRKIDKTSISVISSGDVTIVADIFGLGIKEVELSKYTDLRPKIIFESSNLVELSVKKEKDSITIFSSFEGGKIG